MIRLPHRMMAMFTAVAALAPSPGFAKTWVADPAKSRIVFSGQQTGLPFHGRFDRFNVSIDFDPAHPETGHIVAAIDLSSARTGDNQRDAALPGTDWFDVAHNRTARFESVAIRKTGVSTYLAQARLTIRGQTRPVTLPFKLEFIGTTAHAIGHADVTRTAFGVGQGTWASEQWVALKVGIDIDVTATSR